MKLICQYCGKEETDQSMAGFLEQFKAVFEVEGIPDIKWTCEQCETITNYYKATTAIEESYAKNQTGVPSGTGTD